MTIPNLPAIVIFGREAVLTVGAWTIVRSEFKKRPVAMVSVRDDRFSAMHVQKPFSINFVESVNLLSTCGNISQRTKNKFKRFRLLDVGKWRVPTCAYYSILCSHKEVHRVSGLDYQFVYGDIEEELGEISRGTSLILNLHPRPAGCKTYRKIRL